MNKDSYIINGYKGKWEVLGFEIIDKKTYFLLNNKKYKFFLVIDSEKNVLTQTRSTLDVGLASIGIIKDYYKNLEESIKYLKMRYQ